MRISPSMTTVCSDYLKKLAVWESELCMQRAMDNFDKLCEDTTADSFICEATVSELHLAIRHLLEGAKGTLEQVATVAIVIRPCCRRRCQTLHKRRNGRASS